MIPSSIEVTNIPQLKDNYSYVISSKENDSAIIVDPAESSSILKFIKNKTHERNIWRTIIVL